VNFRAILGTEGTSIALTWRGLYTQRAEAFRNNKSGTKYCMPETSQRKAALRGSSTTRNELRLKRSALWTCFAKRAAPLWTARRKHIAARGRSACRSRFAALAVVRRRFAASAPALRAAALVSSLRSCFGESRQVRRSRRTLRRGQRPRARDWRPRSVFKSSNGIPRHIQVLACTSVSYEQTILRISGNYGMEVEGG
jgi:hypothetical protein